MSGALLSTGWIAPTTLQNAPFGSLASLIAADATVAPVVGRPIPAAGSEAPVSAAQRAATSPAALDGFETSSAPAATATALSILMSSMIPPGDRGHAR